MGSNKKAHGLQKRRSKAQGAHLFGKKPLPYRKYMPATSPSSSAQSYGDSSPEPMDVDDPMDISAKDYKDVQVKLNESRTRADHYEKRTRNEHRCADRARKSRDKLQAAYDSLQDTSMELEDQNAHLEAVNEDLTFRNEELQAENKELLLLAKTVETDLIQVKSDLQEMHHLYKQHVQQMEDAGKDTDALRQLYSAQLEKTLERNTYLEKEVKRLWVRSYRAPGQKQAAVDKATKRTASAKASEETYHMKDNGMVPEETRAMIRELVGLGISVTHIAGAISAVARAMGVKVEGSISARTVSRIVLEGGVAAQMQLAYEAHKAKYLTISGDGTSDRHVNYESKFMTLDVDGYDGTGVSDVPVSRFMGICSALSHTSEEQYQGWLETIKIMYELYNNSPTGKKHPLDPREFALFITGLNTDHAEDQKKLARLMRLWKRTCDRETRGRCFLTGLAPDELVEILCAETERKIAEAGGSDEWDKLTVEEQYKHNQSMYENTCIQYGEEAFEALLPEEQIEADFFIWAGCCMHKEMNSVKGGAAHMATSWKEAGITGPVLLLNRDNAAAAAFGPSAAKSRAEDVSQGGGIKLASLAGAIFHHKDRKKGQQDTFQNFMEDELGYPVQRFPDTSNIRYQSFCSASAELIMHGEHYIKFLQSVRGKKGAGTLNNMEANLLKALQDDPTQTESAVLAVYEQLISIPYMLEVRGDSNANLLDLGPLHDQVKVKLQTYIENPKGVIGPDATPSTGTLNGKPWERPELFYRIHQLQSDGHLPNLEGAFVSFCQGAFDTWEKFTSEFTAGSDIDKATPQQRRRAFMRPTNDLNEGSLGGFRGVRTKSPTITLHQRNARTMHKRNNTHRWMLWVLGPEDFKYIRAMARTIDSSGIAAQERIAQATHHAKTSAANIVKSDALKDKKAAASAAIEAVVLILDIPQLKGSFNRTKVGEIDSQLDWHRRHSDHSIAVKSKLGNKRAKFDRLVLAVEHYLTPFTIAAAGDTPVEGDSSMENDVHTSIQPDGLVAFTSSGQGWEDEFDPGYH